MLGWRAGGLGWWLWLVGGAGGLGYWVGLAGWPGLVAWAAGFGWWPRLVAWAGGLYWGLYNIFKVLTFFKPFLEIFEWLGRRDGGPGGLGWRL